MEAWSALALVFAVTTLFTITLLIPQQHILSDARDALCAGNTHFVFADTAVVGYSVWAPTPAAAAADPKIHHWPVHRAKPPRLGAAMLHGPLQGNTEACLTCFGDQHLEQL